MKSEIMKRTEKGSDINRNVNGEFHLTINDNKY